MTDTHIIIKNGKLVLVSKHGSEYGIGIRGVKKDIAQIKSSVLELKQSTKDRLSVLEAGLALWVARKGEMA